MAILFAEIPNIKIQLIISQIKVLDFMFHSVEIEVEFALECDEWERRCQVSFGVTYR